jgi:hypothetical protein
VLRPNSQHIIHISRDVAHLTCGNGGAMPQGGDDDECCGGTEGGGDGNGVQEGVELEGRCLLLHRFSDQVPFNRKRRDERVRRQ